MLKNLGGGAIINYGQTLPVAGTAFDGTLFYKTSGTDQGLYIFGFNPDADLAMIGEQVAQGWYQVQSPSLYVSKAGDEMDATLRINHTSTGTAFGSGETVLLLNNTAATSGARSGAISWSYANSSAVSAQIDTIVGPSNSKGTLVFSTRGPTGTLAERVRIDETGISLVGGQAFWHGGNDGAGSGLDADLLDGQNGTYYLNANNINAGTLDEAHLPYVPVQQGGSTNMAANSASNRIHIGLGAGSRLFLGIGTAAGSTTWPIDINGNAATANSATTAGTAADATDAVSSQYIRSGGTSGGTNLTFTATGGSGSPTYVWGSSTIGGVSNPYTTANLVVLRSTDALHVRTNGSSGGAQMTFTWTLSAGTPERVWGCDSSDNTAWTVWNPATWSVAAAAAVPWTGVTGRPTDVSDFANDAGYLTVTTGNTNYLRRANNSWITSAEGDNRFYFYTDGRTLYSSANGHEFRHNGSTTTFFVDTAGNAHVYGDFTADGDITASGNVSAFSDRRLKKDIETIPDALAKVESLTGVTYTRIDSGERGTGLIAQDVQAVLPEAVQVQVFDQMLAVSYGNLVGLLVEAIKELNAKIETLEERINGNTSP